MLLDACWAGWLDVFELLTLAVGLYILVLLCSCAVDLLAVGCWVAVTLFNSVVVVY